ncbi:8590_t:CDS:2, partial [Rhizophagus irregularis]
SNDDDSRRNQINAIAARKQNKPYVILVEKNLAGASSTKKRKRDDNQQISPIENSADSSIPNAFLSPIMLSYLVTPKNLQPDTTLDNMVNDASKSKSSYFHDPEPNNENNNEYDDNIWEMEYDDDINNIDQEEESSPKNNSGGDDDEEHHIYDIDQKGEGLVPKTHRWPDGLDIKVALIVGSSDIPATRKLQYAHEWLRCFSKPSREAHFKELGVRWSELLCLPYMDPIRFAVVDPMHCLFLGSYPNSNRQIEPELMRIVLKNTFVDYHLSCRWLSGLLEESLYLFMPKKAVGSLALTAEREELQHFLLIRYMLFKIYGTEPIPGQLLKPSYIYRCYYAFRIARIPM